MSSPRHGADTAERSRWAEEIYDLTFFKDNPKARAHIKAFIRARPENGKTEFVVPLDELQIEMEERANLAVQAMKKIREAEDAQDQDLESFRSFKFDLIQFSWFGTADLDDLRMFVRLTDCVTMMNSLNALQPLLGNYLHRPALASASHKIFVSKAAAISEEDDKDDDGDSAFREGLNPDKGERSQREKNKVSYSITEQVLGNH